MKREQSILVVDDEQIMQDLYCRLLKKECKIVTAKDGFEALQAVKSNHFDIIFMDIKMPGMNGVETYREIRKIDPGVKVFMMTAFEVPDLIEEALAEGADGCLYKPFDIEDVVRAAGGQEPSLERLPVKNKDAKLLLDVEGVFYISSQDGHVWVHTVNQKLLTGMTLTEIGARLSSRVFARVHRSYIVNLSKVRGVVSISRTEILLVMMDKKGSKIPVTPDRSKEIKQLLGV